MSTPLAAHKGLVGIERNPTNDIVAESNSKIDATALTGFGGVTDASISTNGNSVDVAELGDDGMRRLLGRSDATMDLTVNYDPGSSQHLDLLRDARDENFYTVAIDFDNTQSPSDRFAVAFVAKVDSAEVTAEDDQEVLSVSFSMANGNDYLSKTMNGALSDTTTTPVASHKARIQITGDPVSVTGQSTRNVSGNIYEIDQQSGVRDVWDPTAEVNVYENGTLVTSGYTEQYLLGRIKFDSAPTEPVTVDVSYLPRYTVAEVHAFTLTADGKLNDTPTLGDRGQRRHRSHYDFTANFDQYELGDDTLDSGGTEDQYIEVFTGDRQVVLAFDFDTTVSPVTTMRAIGRFNTVDEDVSQDAIQSANFNFEASQFNKFSDNLALPELFRIKDD